MKLRFEQGMEFEDVAIYDLLRRARRLLLLRLLCQVGVHGLFGLSFLYSLCPCWRLPVGITDIFLTYPEGLLLINPWPSTTRSSRICEPKPGLVAATLWVQEKLRVGHRSSRAGSFPAARTTAAAPTSGRPRRPTRTPLSWWVFTSGRRHYRRGAGGDAPLAGHAERDVHEAQERRAERRAGGGGCRRAARRRAASVGRQRLPLRGAQQAARNATTSPPSL